MKLNDSNVKWSFGYLIGTTVVFIILQVIKTNISASAADESGLLTNIMTALTNVLPILASGVLCRYYWREMDRDIQRKQLGDSIYPSLMVAQGTFYTFVGISIVLFTFDGNDVSNIISGTKLAFFTSVIGLLSSLAAKIYLKRVTEEYGIGSSDEYQYYDEAAFFDMMKKINESIREQNAIIEKNLNKRLDIVTKGLTNMVEKVTAEHLEKTKECYISLQEASDKVNRDLVIKVNEYLGSIDKSVSAMQSFSGDFKTQLRDMKKGFTELNKALGTMSKNSENFTTQIGVNFSQLDKALVDFLNNTSGKFETLNKTVTELSQTLVNMDFTNIMKSVDTAFTPLIKQAGEYNTDMKNVVDQVKTMTQSSLNLMDMFNETLNNMKKQQEVYADIFKEYTDGTAMKISKMGETVDKDLNSVQGSLERLSLAFNTATKTIQESNVKNADDLKQYYENMAKYTNSAALMAENMDKISSKSQKQIEQHEAVLKSFNEVAMCAYSNVMEAGGKHHNIADLLNGLNNAYNNLRILCESLQENQNYLNHEINVTLDKLSEMTGRTGPEKLNEAIQLKDLSTVPDFVEDDEDYDVEPPTIEESK